MITVSQDLFDASTQTVFYDGHEIGTIKTTGRITFITRSYFLTGFKGTQVLTSLESAKNFLIHAYKGRETQPKSISNTQQLSIF